MIPTNRLRQVEIMLVPDDGHLVESGYGTVTGYKLQQWWSLTGASPESIANLQVAVGIFDCGEWRDVEIVEKE